jgi:acetylornithine deacetylase/succinyl-diaminopimelate desuccinylase-like protein
MYRCQKRRTNKIQEIYLDHMNTTALSNFNLETIKKLVSIPSTIGDTGAIENFVSSRLEKVKAADVELQKVQGIGNNVIASVIHDRNNPTILRAGC